MHKLAQFSKSFLSLLEVNIEDKVVMQIKLALEQIASNKEIDVSRLDKKQLEMYQKVVGLTNEIDIERGINHVK